MTNAIDAAVPWIASGAVVVFLTACVWHNRRTGYKRARAEKLSFREAMARIRQSLALGDETLPFATQPSTPAIITSTQTEQLLSLHSALKRPAVPAQVNNEVDVPLTEESAVRH
jgi:hypothetical protein